MPSISALCPLAETLPRSLDALAETASVSYVEGGLETLALIGTQLDSALVTTNNGRTLLSGVGGFASYQDNSSPFCISQRRLTFRVNPQTSVQLARIDGHGGAQSALTVADAHGALSLRIETDGGYDGAVLAGLAAAPRRQFAPTRNPSVLAENVIELAAVRRTRANWADRDMGQHLNDMLNDEGRARCRALPHLGRGRARAVLVEVLPSFLTYLADRNIVHLRLIPGAGYLQGDVFRSGVVRKLGQVFLMEGDRQSFAMDISQIGSCWVTYFQHTAQLEIYDSSGRIMSVIAQDVNGDNGRWRALLESLPASHFMALSDEP